MAEDESKSQLRSVAKEYRDELTRRGIIYLTRIPPFMKPNKIRSIFEVYGEVTRLYLAEEGYGLMDCMMSTLLLRLQIVKFGGKGNWQVEMVQSNLRKVNSFHINFLNKCVLPNTNTRFEF